MRRHSSTAACGISPGRTARSSVDSSIAATITPSLSNAQAASLSKPPKPRITIVLFRFLFDFRPSVLERHGPVEHHPTSGGVLVHAKISKPLELVACERARAVHGRLNLGGR